MQPLTKRQHELLNFVTEFINAHGFAPSLQEICAGFGLSSLATVHKHLEALKSKGYIRRRWNSARYLEIVGGGDSCPHCGQSLKKVLDETKVSLENERKVCEDKAVEKGAVTPVST